MSDWGSLGFALLSAYPWRNAVNKSAFKLHGKRLWEARTEDYAILSHISLLNSAFSSWQNLFS
jgi:hypothetical protein